MDWDEEGSGTSGVMHQKAFPEVFGYANAMACFDPASQVLAADVVERGILANLDAGCPVAIGIDGHQAVADGYGYVSGTLYTHVNLGWDGVGDVWYNLPEIEVGEFGYTSSILDEIVYNIFPEKTGEIVSGRVLNPDGTPLAGAVVSVAKADGGAVIGTATSGDRGVWAYVGVPSGTAVKVTASYSGRSFDTVDVDVGTSHYNAGDVSDRDCGNRWGVDLVAYDAGKGNVRGFVRTRTGLPVPGSRRVVTRSV